MSVLVRLEPSLLRRPDHVRHPGVGGAVSRSAEETSPRTASRPRTAAVRDVAVFALVALLLLAGLTAGQPLEDAVRRHREPFTELWFDDVERQPAIDGDRATVSFTIRNAEGRPTTYGYTVLVNGDSVLRATTPSVPASGRHTATHRVPLPGGRSEVELGVRLQDGTSVHRWIDRGRT